MKKFLLEISLASAAMALASCASSPPAQTFTAPSLAPAQQAVARVEQHVSGARGVAQKLAADCDKKNADWNNAYTQLTNELNGAYIETQSLQQELGVKQAEIKQTIDSANKNISDVSRDRDTQRAKAVAEYKKKMFWMKAFFAAAATTLLLTAWTLRGLWMPMLAGFGI